MSRCFKGNVGRWAEGVIVVMTFLQIRLQKFAAKRINHVCDLQQKNAIFTPLMQCMYNAARKYGKQNRIQNRWTQARETKEREKQFNGIVKAFSPQTSNNARTALSGEENSYVLFRCIKSIAAAETLVSLAQAFVSIASSKSLSSLSHLIKDSSWSGWVLLLSCWIYCYLSTRITNVKVS